MVAGRLVQDLAEHSDDLEEEDHGLEDDLEGDALPVADWQRCTSSPIAEEEPEVNRQEDMGSVGSGSQEDLELEDVTVADEDDLSLDVEACHESDGERTPPEVPIQTDHVSLMELKLSSVLAPDLACARTVVPSGVGGVWEEAWTSAAPAIQLPQAIPSLPQTLDSSTELTSPTRTQHATAAGHQPQVDRSADDSPDMAPVIADGLVSVEAASDGDDDGIPAQGQHSAHSHTVLECDSTAEGSVSAGNQASDATDGLPPAHQETDSQQPDNDTSKSHGADDLAPTLSQAPLKLTIDSTTKTPAPTQSPVTQPDTPSAHPSECSLDDAKPPAGDQAIVPTQPSPSGEQPGEQAPISPSAKPTVTYLSVFGRRDQSASQSVSGPAGSRRDAVPPSMATETSQRQATSPTTMDQDTDTPPTKPARNDPIGGTKDPPSAKEKDKVSQHTYHSNHTNLHWDYFKYSLSFGNCHHTSSIALLLISKLSKDLSECYVGC